MSDPWKHRSTGMKCRTCMWYVEKEAVGVVTIGRCRRHAPSMNGYPVVYPYDWCGDHKLDEQKVQHEETSMHKEQVLTPIVCTGSDTYPQP